MATSGSNDDLRVNEILDILTKSSDSGYIGEPVSQLEHALQAAHLARKARCSDELILAALLHDIGHLIASPEAPQMNGLGAVGHEDLGARFLLDRGFSWTVAELVRGHVQAKRYLTFENEPYVAKLSPASRRTLDFQGGPMTAVQAAEFQRDVLFKEKVRIRKFDEAAKRTELSLEPVESYRETMLRHLANRSKGTGT